MKKFLAFFLVLCTCTMLIISATAVDPKQCSHPKSVQSSYIVNAPFKDYKNMTCDLSSKPHTHTRHGTCTLNIWTCVTCGCTTSKTETNIKILWTEHGLH